MPLPLVASAAAAFTAVCPPSLIPSWIQDLNTLAGLIGFAITVGVWWQVRHVRHSFRSRARIPQLADRLKQQRRTLEALLQQSPDSIVGVQQVLSVAGALLNNALPVLPRRCKRSTKDALRTLAQASRVLDDGGLARKKAVAAAFGALCAAVVDLDQVSLDLKWS